MGPIFTFRKARLLDRLLRLFNALVPWRDDYRTPGLVKVWSGYECVCANPKGSHRYCITKSGSYLAAGQAAPARATQESPPKSLPLDDGALPEDSFPDLYDDMVLPGERMRR